MTSSRSSAPRNSADTRARILLVAQEIFSTKGYSHAGLREIARLAEVAPSLLIKYYDTKAQLFEEALAEAIVPIPRFLQDRSCLGEAIVAAVLDPGSGMHAPAMIALALGDPESREVVIRVVKAQIIDPMKEWLGSEHASAQALNILAMTTGFSIFHRNMQPELSPEERAASARLFAQSLQALADLADS